MKISTAIKVYGYVKAFKFIATGTTARGAKIAASKAGINKACFKNLHNGLVYPFATKQGGKWS
jgi:hypothetical protein